MENLLFLFVLLYATTIGLISAAADLSSNPPNVYCLATTPSSLSSGSVVMLTLEQSRINNAISTVAIPNTSNNPFCTEHRAFAEVAYVPRSSSSSSGSSEGFCLLHLASNKFLVTGGINPAYLSVEKSCVRQWKWETASGCLIGNLGATRGGEEAVRYDNVSDSFKGEEKLPGCDEIQSLHVDPASTTPTSIVTSEVRCIRINPAGAYVGANPYDSHLRYFIASFSSDSDTVGKNCDMDASDRIKWRVYNVTDAVGKKGMCYRNEATQLFMAVGIGSDPYTGIIAAGWTRYCEPTSIWRMDSKGCLTNTVSDVTKALQRDMSSGFSLVQVGDAFSCPSITIHAPGAYVKPTSAPSETDPITTAAMVGMGISLFCIFGVGGIIWVRLQSEKEKAPNLQLMKICSSHTNDANIYNSYSNNKVPNVGLYGDVMLSPIACSSSVHVQGRDAKPSSQPHKASRRRKDCEESCGFWLDAIITLGMLVPLGLALSCTLLSWGASPCQNSAVSCWVAVAVMYVVHWSIAILGPVYWGYLRKFRNYNPATVLEALQQYQPTITVHAKAWHRSSGHHDEGGDGESITIQEQRQVSISSWWNGNPPLMLPRTGMARVRLSTKFKSNDEDTTAVLKQLHDELLAFVENKDKHWKVWEEMDSPFPGEPYQMLVHCGEPSSSLKGESSNEPSSSSSSPVVIAHNHRRVGGCCGGTCFYHTFWYFVATFFMLSLPYRLWFYRSTVPVDYQIQKVVSVKPAEQLT